MPDAANASALFARIRDHFGVDPSRLPVVFQQIAGLDRPNLHFAIEAILAEPGTTHEVLGVVSLERDDITLPLIVRPGSGAGFDEGPIVYHDTKLPENRRLACPRNSLYLLRLGSTPAIILLEGSSSPWRSDIAVEVMAEDRLVAEHLSRQITQLVLESPAFRGHTLSLESACGGLEIRFHTLPKIAPQDLVLPEPIRKRVERHTVAFNQQAGRLRSSGRHLKRGILLYGPPGTGKTLTAKYLAAQMPGRTVVILAGSSMSAIETACRIATSLAPSMVILEDVDLIGTERHRQSIGANALLFELLNEMDGLQDDKDVIFLLTTNRPTELEPALASRPGRIDQAIEIPLPDAECRRRLIELYARGLTLQVERMDDYVAKIEGVSGSFVKELLRKAALFAAEESDAEPLIVRDRHFDDALGELLFAGGALTQTLLGVVPPVPV